MGKLWDIIETWRDGMEFPPSYRQIAIRLDVSQSTFDTWKNPIEVPARRNLLAISKLTGKPYQVVVQAAVDDTKLFDEAAAERAATAYRRGKSEGRAMRDAHGEAEAGSQDPGGMEPA